MKSTLPSIMACALACGPCLSDAATVLTMGKTVNTAIPDDNGSGVASGLTVASGGQTVTSVEVSLLTLKGWNGDIYAYLQHNGVISVLLNRTGRTAVNPAGAATSGMQLRFADSAPADIHNAITGVPGAVANGTYQPDARAADPGLVDDTSPRSLYLSGFNGQNADGEWTLFVADLSGGDIAILEEWSISITMVPEPATGLLLLCGALPLLARRRRIAPTVRPTRGLVPKGVPLVLFLSAQWLSAYERLQGPTELLFHDPSKAFAGYTLFGVGNRTWLLDMEGRVVHAWPVGTNPHLLDDGHILDASKDDPSGFQGFKEVDWDGKTVWEYTERRENYSPHHDWVRIRNKALNAPTTLYIANKSVSREQALAAGADPATGPDREGQMDAIVEVDMQGKVVWEWWFFDHVVQNVDPARPNHVGAGKVIADRPGRLDINLPGRPLRRDWLHCNSLDYNPKSGHLVINSVQGELYVIDHDGTFVANDAAASVANAASPAGDFLYRFGDPARYGQGDPPRVLENWDSATAGHKQMGGSHHATWIPQGLPGAGNLMVFNNGQYLYQRTPQSSILEINPFLDGRGEDTGEYVNPPEAGYTRESYDKDTHNQPRQVSRQIVWSYRSANSHGFFSHIGSSGQRLPNGNTFICSDTEGHFFEVTAKGELAWEYINPVTRDGPVKVLGDTLPMTNSAFRAFRCAPDHPALRGRELKPAGTITERAEQGVDVYQKRREPGDQGAGQGKPDGGGRAGRREPGGGQGGRGRVLVSP